MSAQARVAFVLDRDCPSCDWPELVAEGESFEAGPDRVLCRKCGWSEAVQK